MSSCLLTRQLVIYKVKRRTSAFVRCFLCPHIRGPLITLMERIFSSLHLAITGQNNGILTRNNVKMLRCSASRRAEGFFYKIGLTNTYIYK